MTHTPGPWEARLQQADGYFIKKEGWEIRTDAYDVATWIQNGAPIRKEADALLLAAAPEMLEALEAVAKADERDEYIPISDVRTAIAKARGRPPKEDPGYFGPEPEDFT